LKFHTSKSPYRRSHIRTGGGKEVHIGGVIEFDTLVRLRSLGLELLRLIAYGSLKDVGPVGC